MQGWMLMFFIIAVQCMQAKPSLATLQLHGTAYQLLFKEA